MGLDRETGQLLWQDVAWTGEPERTHNMNMFASATCATDGEVVVSHRPGLAICYNAATGKELDRIRPEGKVSASPISANGLVYISNEAGDVYVFEPGQQLKIVATNRFATGDDEIFRRSITPSRGELLIRSDRVLYCVTN